MVEGVRPEAAPRLEEVAEAAGDEHAHPRPAALQHGVGGDGGAVQEQRAVREQMLDARRERASGLLHHVEHAAARIGGHRRHLEDVEAPGAVHQHHVGEGAADVDGDAVPGPGFFPIHLFLLVLTPSLPATVASSASASRHPFVPKNHAGGPQAMPARQPSGGNVAGYVPLDVHAPRPSLHGMFGMPRRRLAGHGSVRSISPNEEAGP